MTQEKSIPCEAFDASVLIVENGDIVIRYSILAPDGKPKTVKKTISTPNAISVRADLGAALQRVGTTDGH